MDGRARWTRVAALAAILFGSIAFGAARAATLNVNTFHDEVTSEDSQCSLREAVATLNAGADSVDCVNAAADVSYGTKDTIKLPAGTYELTIPQPIDDSSPHGEYQVAEVTTGEEVTGYSVSVTPDNSVGDLDIVKSVTIVGAEPGATIQAGPGFNDRILHLSAETGTVDVTLEGVTVQGGSSPLNDLELGTDTSGNPWALRVQGGGIATGVGAAAYNTATSGSDTGGDGGGEAGGGETGPTYVLTLNNAAIVDNSAGDGGGLYSTATLTAYQTTISGNKATANGGGLYNDAAMTLIATTLDRNEAEGGGGFFDTGSHESRVFGSTISRNHAVGGGGVSSRVGVTLTLADSTVSGNKADDTGGGLYTNGIVKLYFVTVADNEVSGETGETEETEPSADAGTGAGGAGINTFGGGTFLLSNTLLANNAVGGVVVNCGASGGSSSPGIDDQGYNLDSGSSCQLSAGGDLSMVNPLIGPLADNGGPTETHQLLPGSPAINAGNDPGVTFDLPTQSEPVDPAAYDQRGSARNDTPDIGAYEVWVPSPSPPPAEDGTGTVTGGGGGGCTVGATTGFDPMLIGLALVAFGGLAWRRRHR